MQPTVSFALSVLARGRVLLFYGLLGLLVTLTLTPRLAAAGDDSDAARRLPVILDTDIGDDIDDTWALGFLLKCPEFDVRLVVGDQGKNLYRARLIARFLEVARRTDIPIGLGLDANVTGDGPQAAWVKDYNLNAYPGKVYPDGVRAMIDTILASPTPVTLIAIGPVPNLAAALEREPRIAQRARLVGMHGSVRRGYGAGSAPAAEYNVKADAQACQRAFTAPWAITITPLDTCDRVALEGEHYRRMREADDPVARAILENYRLWSARQDPKDGPARAEVRSSTLFDTVAIYLALRTDGLVMEDLGIRVREDGFTVIDPQAKVMRVATDWQDLAGFKGFLVDRLTGTRAAVR
jgi:inosine-uridine nucleoside N-ribohydrolase